MDINQIIAQIVLFAPPILLALTLHEFAHGYIALRLGDPTAKAAGRLTLNPLKHLDPIGTIAIFIIHFGWAKPVPVNPVYFRNPRQDMLWVALAGPVTNMAVAILSAIVLKVLLFFHSVIPLNELLFALFYPFEQMLVISVKINMVLCIFNFLPIPPLDGSRILMGLLPDDLARSYASIEKYGFIILLILAFSGLLSKLIFPVIHFANSFLLS